MATRERLGACTRRGDDALLDAAADLHSSIELNGFGASSTLLSSYQLSLALKHAGKIAESKTARVTYATWLTAAATEWGERATEELSELARYLGALGEHAEAALVLGRAEALANPTRDPNLESVR